MSEKVNIPADLISRAQKGDEDATMTVVAEFMPVVRAAVLKLTGQVGVSADDREDLEQDGRIAVLLAIQTKDLDSDASFVTHAHWRVHQAIRRAWTVMSSALGVAATDRTERIMRALRAAEGDVSEALSTLNEGASKGSRDHVSRATVSAVASTTHAAERFDAPVCDGDEGEALTLADVLPDDSAQRPDLCAEARVLCDQVFREGTERHTFILRSTYGFDMIDYGMYRTYLTDDEVAAHLGVRRPTVRWHRSKALDAARTTLGVCTSSVVGVRMSSGGVA